MPIILTSAQMMLIDLLVTNGIKYISQATQAAIQMTPEEVDAAIIKEQERHATLTAELFSH